MKQELPKKAQATENPKPTNNQEHAIYKTVFIASFVLLGLIMTISGWGTGFHSDEMDQNAYGKAAIKYYSSLGKDTSFLDLHLPDGTKVAEAIKTYGVLYDMILNAITSALGVRYEYDVRHFIIQLTALACMFLTGLIIRKISGSYLAATIGLWMLFLTPTFFGHSLMNARDIPFAFGYILAIFFLLRYFDQLHELKWKPLLWLGLAMGVSVSVRIGGLILFPIIILYLVYLYFTNSQLQQVIRKNLNRILLQIGVLLAITYLFALISHPLIFSAPIDNFMLCINTAKKFPNKIPLAFDGEYISSLEIPKNYLLVWYKNTVPILVIILFLIGCYFMLFKTKAKPKRQLILLFICFIFPVSYAIYNSFSLYNGWRHLLFVYPCAIILSAFWIPRLRPKGIMGPALLSLTLVGLGHPIYKMIRNHPFEYLYFNEISGGFAKNYLLFETDVWQLSACEAVNYLMQDENFRNSKSVTLASNSYSPIYDIIRNKYGDTAKKIFYAGLNNKNMTQWEYFIFNVNLLPPNIIENQYPPSHTIKTFEYDGKILCAIVHDSVRNDYWANYNMNKKNYKVSDSLYLLAFKDDPDSERLLEGYCIGMARRDQLLNAKKYFDKGLEIYPNNSYFIYFKAMETGINGNYTEAIKGVYRALENGLPESAAVYNNLSILYEKAGDMNNSRKMKQYVQEMLNNP